jgi:hypothetical protein
MPLYLGKKEVKAKILRDVVAPDLPKCSRFSAESSEFIPIYRVLQPSATAKVGCSMRYALQVAETAT